VNTVFEIAVGPDERNRGCVEVRGILIDRHAVV
jgi:hypothetical protein